MDLLQALKPCAWAEVCNDAFFKAEIAEFTRNDWARYSDGFLELYWMGGEL